MSSMSAQCLLLLTLAVSVLASTVPAWYKQERQTLLAEENGEMIGNTVTLTTSEEEVNRILMKAKNAEIHNAIYKNKPYLSSIHFFKSRQLIEQSRVFQIIRKMPKGAVLHVHSGSMVSLDWLVKNVTYRPHCYMCMKNNTIVKTGFFLTPPPNQDCTWQETAIERAKSSDVIVFDQSLYEKFTLSVDNPEVAYPDINAVWGRFQHYFDATMALFNYVPVLRDSLYESLRQFRDDGVQYTEIRYSSQPPYELDGTTHNHTWQLQTFREVVNNFVQDYPDTSGAKFILNVPKRASREMVLAWVKEAMIDIKEFPDIFLGFDLVQQEDLTNTLLYFLTDLLYPENNSQDMPYFFHAGETDWWGIHDNNLIDAVLLNTTRIGHGFALTKHSEVMRIVKERRIPIEVNPISNQVLKLVSDLRNHPASVLIANDFPVCISSDDPAVWEALPLSHDFYMAFMALASADADLRFLKQIAINSIKFSVMTPAEKDAAMKLWQSKWQTFINDIINTFPLVG